ncbi:MAG: STAS domain-containing protein [Chitinophagia bacterium]|jgi:anti-anti-sigma regulatory factor|nr:STAS domain-containing protein [Chitinophagia bacterium]NCA30872.1 STAS domain-containing protein [Chitinophagia bacterium]NDD15863.1 STAS domain-containing protein [Chitinophagia bacterium]
MQYKTELKEKFTVLTILENSLSSNLVPELAQILTKIGVEPPKNLVLNLGQVDRWELPVIAQLAEAQGSFYENNTSFVICCLSDSLQDTLDLTEYAEIMNLTPTESEAWDIVQMEEIERELLDSDDMEFSNQE